MYFDQPLGAAWLCISTSLWVLLPIHEYLITINKLWHLVYDGIIRLWNGLITPVNIFFQIENITTEDGVKLSDICNNPLEGQTDACNIQNIWAYWQDSLDNLNKVATPAEFPNATYNYLDHFISCSKWVFCSCPISLLFWVSSIGCIRSYYTTLSPKSTIYKLNIRVLAQITELLRSPLWVVRHNS